MLIEKVRFPPRNDKFPSPGIIETDVAKQDETEKTLAAMNSVKSKEECKKKLQILMRAKKEERTIAKCTDEEMKQWKRLSAAVDRGGCDNVAAPEELPAYEDYIIETEASINNDGFVSASGDPIDNYGEVRVPIVTRESTIRGITFTAAGVQKALLSVKKMNDANHTVVFDSEGSFIYKKQTGETNMLREENGNLMLDVWVPLPDVAPKMGFQGRP